MISAPYEQAFELPAHEQVTLRAATFALVMLALTPSGDAHTFRELEAMFRNAGFARSEMRELPGTPSRLVISQ